MSHTVSVIVVTYNSSPFVVETLESIASQTWEDIELIITDDCSVDNTVEVCRNWLSNQSKRFIRSEILLFEKNTGVSANVNRGLLSARGDWVKFIGGDDTLKPGCIEDNISWIDSHEEVKVLFSRLEIYKDTFETNNLLITTPGVPYDQKGLLAPDRSAESQYKMLLLSDRIHFTPTAFFHRETLHAMGGFDERFKMLEDYPLWLSLTKNGYKLCFMDKVTVNYRRHSNAINNTGNPFLINPNYYTSEEFRKIYIYPYLPVDLRLNAKFYWYVSQIFRFNWINRNTYVTRFFLEFLTVYLNPFNYFIFLKKRLVKGVKNNEFYSKD